MSRVPVRVICLRLHPHPFHDASVELNMKVFAIDGEPIISQDLADSLTPGVSENYPRDPRCLEISCPHSRSRLSQWDSPRSR